MGKATVFVLGQDELFSLESGASVAELETEAPATEAPATEPSAADMASAAQLEDILNGYSSDEWIDVMLSLDSHSVGLSRGVAAERLYIERRKAQADRMSRKAQAQAKRAAELEAQAQALQAQRRTKTYAAMNALMVNSELTSRGVVMTLTGRKVTVESVQWSKAERRATTEVIATFTVANGLYKVSQSGGKRYSLNLEQAITFFLTELPERPEDKMPRKYRDIMRTHRHKNMTPSDITGNRAVRKIEAETNDIVSAADTELYPEYAQIEGPRLRTTGKRSNQGQRGMTADERRAADRERLKLWRERKRQEKAQAS
jgi:hypothetical protein